MRLYSTRESVENGEASILALVETVLAMGVSLFVIWRWNYTNHLIMAAFVAPLLLLRTDGSVSLGLHYLRLLVSGQLIRRAIDSINPKIYAYNFKDVFGLLLNIGIDSMPLRIFFGIVVFLFFLVPAAVFSLFAVYVVVSVTAMICLIPTAFIAIACLAAKIAATSVTIFVSPGGAVKAIGRNFFLVTSSVDSAIVPEAIPGIELSEMHDLNFLKFKPMVGFVEDIYEDNWRLGLILGVFVSIIYIPAIAYRLSVKSTALIWLPLIWITRPLRKQENLLQAFTRIRHAAIHWVLRMWSAIVIVSATIKLYLLVSFVRIEAVWAGHPLAELFRSYVLPDSWAVWQIAAVLNGLLAWGLFFFADYFIPRVPPDHADLDSVLVRNSYNAIAMLRSALTFYIIPCTIYIVTRATLDISLPPLETKFFPWQ